MVVAGLLGAQGPVPGTRTFEVAAEADDLVWCSLQLLSERDLAAPSRAWLLDGMFNALSKAISRSGR